MIFSLTILACFHKPAEPIAPSITTTLSPTTPNFGPLVLDRKALEEWLTLHTDTRHIVRLPIKLHPSRGNYDGGWVGNIRIELDEMLLGRDLFNQANQQCYPNFAWASGRQRKRWAEEANCEIWIEGTLTQYNTRFDLRMLIKTVGDRVETHSSARPSVVGESAGFARDYPFPSELDNP